MQEGYTCNDCYAYHANDNQMYHASEDSGGFCASCSGDDLTPDSEQDMEHFIQVFEKQPGIAILIAEGVEKPRSEEEFLAAWQYLHNSGIAYRLQGWFGRRCKDMISIGHIDP